MKKLVIVIFLIRSGSIVNSTPLKWTLDKIQFNDGTQNKGAL
jgi:hypothetical protein